MLLVSPGASYRELTDTLYVVLYTRDRVETHVSSSVGPPKNAVHTCRHLHSAVE